MLRSKAQRPPEQTTKNREIKESPKLWNNRGAPKITREQGRARRRRERGKVRIRTSERTAHPKNRLLGTISNKSVDFSNCSITRSSPTRLRAINRSRDKPRESSLPAQNKLLEASYRKQAATRTRLLESLQSAALARSDFLLSCRNSIRSRRFHAIKMLRLGLIESTPKPSTSRRGGLGVN